MRRLFALSLFFAARTASADEVCVKSFEHAQELRQSGKLREAQAELRSCAKPQCPVFIQRDCNTWATEVEHDLPTLVVVTRNEAGEDVVAQLQIDGVTAVSLGDLRLDPGEHDIRAEAPGYQPSVAHVVIHLGERRNLTLSLTKPPAPPPPPPTKSSGLRTGAWVTGGIALGGFITFGVLATHGYLRENALGTSCSPSCPHDSVQTIRTEYLVGDVALVTGIVTAAVSGILFIASRGHSSSKVAWTFK